MKMGNALSALFVQARRISSQKATSDEFQTRAAFPLHRALRSLPYKLQLTPQPSRRIRTDLLTPTRTLTANLRLRTSFARLFRQSRLAKPTSGVLYFVASRQHFIEQRSLRLLGPNPLLSFSEEL